MTIYYNMIELMAGNTMYIYSWLIAQTRNL